MCTSYASFRYKTEGNKPKHWEVCYKPESEKYEPIEFDIANTAIEKTHPVWQPDSIEHKDVDLDFMGQ